MSAAFDAVLGKLEAADSNLNFYRSLNPRERSTLDNTSLAANSTDSSNALIRSLDPAEFQRLDYGRDTLYNVAQRQECIKRCVRHLGPTYDPGMAYQVCYQQCDDTRVDYV